MTCTAPAAWTGGAVKPAVTPFPHCPGFSPKQADLVVNGIAEATYRHSSGIAFNTVSLVLATRRMVQVDWRWTVLDPRVPACLRYRMIQDARSSKFTFISLARLPFPRVARFTSAYRVIYDDRTTGKKVRIFLDLVSFGRGRTEVLMSTTGPLIGADGVLDAEIRLGRILVSRTPAWPLAPGSACRGRPRSLCSLRATRSRGPCSSPCCLCRSTPSSATPSWSAWSTFRWRCWASPRL